MYPCGGAFCPPDSQDALRTFGDRKNQKSMGVIEETMKLSLVQPNFSFFCLPGFELLSLSTFIILNSTNQINAFPYSH